MYFVCLPGFFEFLYCLMVFWVFLVFNIFVGLSGFLDFLLLFYGFLGVSVFVSSVCLKNS